ncbi:MAG: hypothetical protein KF735_02195 [Chelatococcus sp.]|uniref:hypothetical protein n=1 Tax=Chelatococcus sp. TaxID=1953771 RepID=UPI0025C05592|nr:hypothetical protein [Chelatococcus sp.]MBX3536423.1 hypothetical protein [Chelatococcus sp.]
MIRPTPWWQAGGGSAGSPGILTVGSSSGTRGYSDGYALSGVYGGITHSSDISALVWNSLTPTVVNSAGFYVGRRDFKIVINGLTVDTSTFVNAAAPGLYRPAANITFPAEFPTNNGAEVPYLIISL